MRQEMTDSERISTAWNQLNLVLSFYSRIDTKTSVILGINLGMLAVLFTRVPPVAQTSALQWAFAVPFFFVVAMSFYHLHKGVRPHLDGGTNSLVYFRTIATMTESEFTSACKQRSSADLADDLHEQAWRNSKILNQKFDALRRAHDTALLAVIPWLGCIALTAK
jgi:hypothetical protein